MIERVSAAVSAGPLGRLLDKSRNGPMHRVDLGTMLDWVIPPALTLVIVATFVWLILAAA